MAGKRKSIKLYYAGIGSRETPPDVQFKMKVIAAYAEECGLILRSGAAKGADEAFESGIFNKKNKQIFLPWEKYNDHPAKIYNLDDDEEALDSVREFHPHKGLMSRGSVNLHARNYQIICGPVTDRQLVEFVCCWTPDGATNDKQRKLTTGGTGQGISIADHFDIPVYNLKHPLSFDLVIEHIEELNNIINSYK